MPKKKISYTFTLLIWIGIILVLFGAIVAALGLGGSIAFQGSFGDLKIKTNQTGLVIAIIGAALSGTVALNLPKGVMILSNEEKLTLTERMSKKMPIIAVIIIILAAVFLILPSI